MAVASDSSSTSGASAPGRFPTAYTILFGLIVVMAVLTWIIPAGEYERVANETLGKDVPVPGSYQPVDAAPQTLIDVLIAPIAGFYDPASYEANAIDVSLFVLIVGGFLGVVTATGAINTGIAQAMRRLEGREKWMIPIMMALFAAGGTTYGMAEETLAFYVLLIPIMIAAGYDALTGVAIIMLGAGVGVIGSTINPFSTAIASDAAGIPFTQGMVLRFVILGLSWIAAVAFVMRYAEQVRRDPSRSLVADMKEANEAHFLQGRDALTSEYLSGLQIVILLLFAATFGVMVWGVSSQGWWMAEMSALFLGASILIGTLAWLGEKAFTTAFVNGARDLLGVALVIGLARGIVIIMDQGRITDTILYTFEGWISGMSEVAFINALFGIEALMSFLVPSTSGLAVLSMPIMAPLSDFAGVSRDLAVTAFQTAIGITNLVAPTYAVVVGGLAIGRVPYNRWLRFIWPLLLILSLLSMGLLSLAVML
ncbi:YfcC family protein [Litoreibacter roseus]|uniref:C4-dicarboxylate ABC transporter n=1 Tax=Litoreibacter roseus TaxID=2601869 RepID=A0A6N6JJX3_9RHOB|nr:YfcC family protein [Litoreibacter roseus]GFE65492.1 C4-dicarboxylate ABC transporter [Litoreibacter roseus]